MNCGKDKEDGSVWLPVRRPVFPGVIRSGYQRRKVDVFSRDRQSPHWQAFTPSEKGYQSRLGFDMMPQISSRYRNTDFLQQNQSGAGSPQSKVRRCLRNCKFRRKTMNKSKSIIFSSMLGDYRGTQLY